MRKREIESDPNIAQAAFLPFQQLIIANNEPIGNYLLGKVAHLWVGKYAEKNLSQCQSRFKTNLPKKFWPWTVFNGSCVSFLRGYHKSPAAHHRFTWRHFRRSNGAEMCSTTLMKTHSAQVARSKTSLKLIIRPTYHLNHSRKSVVSECWSWNFMNETTIERIRNHFLFIFGCRVQFLLLLMVVKRSQNARGRFKKVFCDDVLSQTH